MRNSITGPVDLFVVQVGVDPRHPAKTLLQSLTPYGDIPVTIFLHYVAYAGPYDNDVDRPCAMEHNVLPDAYNFSLYSTHVRPTDGRHTRHIHLLSSTVRQK